jgi:hypothetical protein
MQKDPVPHPQMASPDVIEAGRVLATQPVLWGILFMAAFIIVFLLIFTVWREWAMQSERRLMVAERKEMRALADSFARSARQVANALGDLSTKIAVLSAVASRAESVAGTRHGDS